MDNSYSLRLAIGVTERVSRHRQELCKILISDSTDLEKIAHLRKSILTFRSERVSVDEAPLPAGPPTEEEHKSVEDLAVRFWSDMSTKLSAIEHATNTMKMIAKPAEGHETLLTSIGEILRTDQTPSAKVESISDLLI